MAKRKARAPEPVDETTEEYWDEEESSSTWSSSSAAPRYGSRRPLPIVRQRRMKTVKPKPLKTLMGNDLSKPRKRRITLLKE